MIAEITRAYQIWKENAGVLAAWGILAYVIAFIVGAATYILLAPLGTTIAGSVASTALLLTYGIIGVIAAGAVEDGRATMESIWNRLKRKWLDVGIATIFAWTPFIFGTLALLAAVLYASSSGAETAAEIGLILFMVGWLATVGTAVSPYIADAEGWIAGIEKTWAVVKDRYITLLGLAILFDAIYITYLLTLPTVWGGILAVVDATAIMHLRNLAFYEVTRSVLARE